MGPHNAPATTPKNACPWNRQPAQPPMLPNTIHDKSTRKHGNKLPLLLSIRHIVTANADLSQNIIREQAKRLYSRKYPIVIR